MTRDIHIAKQSFGLMTGRWFSFAVRFILPIILVRLISVENFGIYKKFVLFYSIIIPVIELGLSQGILYFLPKNATNKDKLISNILFTYLSIGLLISLLIFIFRNQLFYSFFKIALTRNLLLAVSTYIFFSISSYSFEYILIALKKAKFAGFIISIREIIRTTLIVSFAFLFKSINGIIWSLSFFSIIYFIIFFVYILRNKFLSISNFNFPYLKRIFKYTVPLGLAGMLNIINNRSSNLIVGILLTSTAYSIYAIGFFRIHVVDMAIRSVSHVLIPNLSQLNSEKRNDVELIRKVWHKAIRYSSLISIPVAFFFIFFADKVIVLLFTEKFVQSINIFRIYLVTYLFSFTFCGVIPRVFGKSAFVLYSNLFILIFSIPLIYVMTKQFSIYGAAISGVFAYVLPIILQLGYSKYLFKIKFKRLLPWKFLGIIYCISFIIGVLINLIRLVALDRISFILVSFTSYLLVYYLCLKLLKIHEVKRLEKKIHNQYKNLKLRFFS